MIKDFLLKNDSRLIIQKPWDPWSGIPKWLQNVIIAAITTLLIYYSFSYIHTGTLFKFNYAVGIELGLTFLYLLSLFWVHARISSFIHLRARSRQNIVFIYFLEGLLVVSATFMLTLLIKHLPLWLTTFFLEVRIPEGRVRMHYVVQTFISLFFYYFVERERSRKQLQAEILHSTQLQKENFQAQLESLKNQVSPHFLFNSLNVLDSLIYKDQDQAVEFVHKLSEVYRSFLDHSQEVLIPLQQEMQLAEAYMYLLKTRFGEYVHFQTNVPAEFHSFQLPPSSLQMLIENAVKHNGSTAQKPLFISICIEENKLVVRNNLEPRLERVPSTKTGLRNIASRYQFLTEEKPDIEKSDNEFIVKLPLLKVEAYEGSAYRR